MELMNAIPLLLLILIGLMLSLVAWGVLRLRRRPVDDAIPETDNWILVGLLVLGVLGFVVFLAYLMLGIGI